MLALQDLYVSTLGENWTLIPSNGIPWNFTDMYNQNPCADAPNNWYGILSCYDNTIQTGYFNIANIELSESNLTLPNTLSSFTEINNFAFASNSLEGTLPNTINFTTTPVLEEIEVSGNYLTGTIPSGLGSLLLLFFLDLGSNYLTGSIPVEIGNATNLNELYIFETFISGPVPSSFSQLVSLEYLVLSLNMLTGSIPAGLGQMSALLWLEMYDNQLSGSFPSDLGDISALGMLWTYANDMTGTLPTSFNALTQLTNINIGDNFHTGSIDQLDYSNFPQLYSVIYAYRQYSRLSVCLF